MPFPVFTNSGGTSPANIGVVIYPGMAVIEISPGIFIPYTAAAALIYVGSAVGCALTTTVPGGPITVQCDGECPSALISIGAGNDSTVVITGVGGFARGTTGLVCGFCDPSGNLTIVPTRIGSQYGTLHNGRALFGTPVTGQSPVLDSTGKFIFQTVLQPGSVTGTGLWFSSSGTLDAAAATLTGDVSQLALSGNNLPLEVTGLLSNALPALSAGYLEWNGSAWSFAPFATAFTPANDLLGNSTSSATHQYVSALSYSSAAGGGSIAVNGTNTLLNWVTNAVTLQQGATTALRLGFASTDFIALGVSPPGAGYIRFGGTNVTLLEGIGGGGVSAPLLVVDSNANLSVGIGTTNPGGLGSNVNIVAQNGTGAVGGNVQMFVGNGSTPGNIVFGLGGGTSTTSTIALLGSSSLGVMQWSAGITPQLSQAKPATDLPTNNWVIQAQSAELAAVTNLTGGSLYLYAGAGATTSGVSGNVYIISPSASGTNGSVIVQAGGTTSVTVGTSIVAWGVVNHGGDVTQSSSFAFKSVNGGGAVNVSSSVALNATQAACPMIQLTGTVGVGGTTLTVPNNLGAFWLLDFTNVTLTGALTITTGSGTTVTIASSAIIGKLVPLAVVANHVLSYAS